MATLFQDQMSDIFDTRQLKIYTNFEQQDPELYSQILKTETSTTRHVDRIRVSGLGLFRDKAEGTPITYDIPVQGARRRTVHQTFGLGYRATWEAIADALHAVLDSMPADLARSAKEHKENLGVDLFDDSFDGNRHTGLDGLSIVNTAHTMLKPPTAGLTLSNELSPGVPLSTEGIEAALTNLSLTQSEEGRQQGSHYPARWLVVHPALQHVAHVLLNTERRAGSDAWDVSTVATSRTGIQPFVWPHLSDEESWWITTSKDKHGMTWNSRQDNTFDRSIDSETKDRKYDVIYRASVDATTWRGIVGSQV